ncbi:MAG TPA: rhamnulokinase family protein [Pseudonocardiaceae bacterium]|nr:rhamnulokinase family protein [Pseudonocardiaceae bacterium]
MVAVVPVDLGASSGRVMLAQVERDRLDLREVHRFANRPVRVRETLHWDILALYQGILDGLRAVADVASVGIDSWAVDYGLLDASGRLLGNPVHYRDSRTTGVAERLPVEQLYSVTGIRTMPITTLCQLVAAGPDLAAADELLLVPDLISYWLTGVRGTEITNASTTGLLAATGGWALDLMRTLDIPTHLFGSLRSPGDPAGVLDVDTGLGPVPVTTVGSHDTASAVFAVPAVGDRFAYISSGTWSLVGLELPAPILSSAGRVAGFTNEAGVDGTVRYLRNVMGLWLLQESMRTWVDVDLAGLLRSAAELPALRSVVRVDDEVYLPPGDMPTRIADECRRTGQPVPVTPAEVTRCVLDSLALAYRSAVEQAQRLADRSVDVVHVVGGGARNGLLCQLTADACGLPVVAGPTEAAALGNALVQARAVGAAPADHRALIRTTQRLRHYLPTGDAAVWQAASNRLGQ